jgi:hypothetical protein
MIDMSSETADRSKTPVPKNWQAREKKIEKRKHGMRMSNRSIFVVQEAEAKRNRRKAERKFDARDI